VSYRNNFCCRLDPVVLEALRERHRRTGETLGPLVSTLVAAGLGLDPMLRAASRLRLGAAVTHPGRVPVAPPFRTYDDTPIGAR
jgi:hypothetical protein